MYKYRDIWHIAYPILISLVMQTLINITDTAYMGRVGEIELGATALVSVYYLTIYMAIFGFSVGAQIFIGRRNGEGSYAKIGDIVVQGILFLLGIAALFVLLSKWLSPILLSSIVSSSQIYEACIDYLDLRIWGLLFSAVSVMCRAFFVGITRTGVLMWNSIILTVSNVIFNYIFVFGALGVPAMGIAGAALGSVISEGLAMLHFVIYALSKLDLKYYGFSSRIKFSPDIIKGILSLSVWTMLQNFLTHAVWFVFFLAIEHLGEEQLAITNIVRSGSSLLFMPIIAFASTASTLVSNALGASRAHDVTFIIRRCVSMAYAVIVPMMVIVAIIPQTFMSIFTNDVDILQGSVASVYVMLGFNLIAIPACIFFHSVSGTGDTRLALGIEIVATILYAVAIYAIIFAVRADVAVCWSVEYIYWTVILLCSVLYFKYGKWQNRAL
ncbi:MAG: MATE family efflux transporter [Muribaculaceae bacterium]|nr:MATE family efflux transporter [Muribaculaceae bacterium]